MTYDTRRQIALITFFFLTYPFYARIIRFFKLIKFIYNCRRKVFFSERFNCGDCNYFFVLLLIVNHLLVSDNHFIYEMCFCKSTLLVKARKDDYFFCKIAKDSQIRKSSPPATPQTHFFVFDYFLPNHRVNYSATEAVRRPIIKNVKISTYPYIM